MAHRYGITTLKERCEKVLVDTLKNSPISPKAAKGPPTFKGRRDNTPGLLLKCVKCADAGDSKALLGECVRIFASPDVPLKDLKASTEISDQVKARIYENRIDQTSTKMNKLQCELEKEKHENEVLQKQMQGKGRGTRIARFGSDPTLNGHHKNNHPIPVSVPPQHAHHYHTHRSQNVAASKDKAFRK